MLFTAWTLEHFQMRRVRPFPIIFIMKITKKRLQEITLFFSGNTCLALSTIILPGSVLIKMETQRKEDFMVYPAMDKQLAHRWGIKG